MGFVPFTLAPLNALRKEDVNKEMEFYEKLLWKNKPNKKASAGDAGSK
jgi:hypothetical protein